MSQTVELIFADAVRPEEFRALVEGLGGVRSPDPEHPDDSSLERDGGRVWVGTHPVGEVSSDTGLRHAYEEVLGTPPRSRLDLEVSREPGSEWLAAEIVLAAAEKWRFVLDDFGEKIITLGEFQTRLAKRQGEFFLPEGQYDPSPAAMRKSRVEPVTLILPATAGRRELESLLRSLGARLRPDDRTDAELSRDGAHVWVHLESGTPAAPDRPAAFTYVLGDPPYRAVALEVFEGERSRLLAVELVEAVAATWGVLILGSAGQLMTIDDLRALVAAGVSNLFSP